MVSRENAVYGIAAAGAIVLFIVIASSSPPDWLASVGLLAYYAVGMGAGHLYLASRNEAGEITVPSRLRFLVALGCWLTLGAIGLFGPDWQVYGIESNALLSGIGVLVLLGYWLLEARDGYRSSRPA